MCCLWRQERTARQQLTQADRWSDDEAAESPVDRTPPARPPSAVLPPVQTAVLPPVQTAVQPPVQTAVQPPVQTAVQPAVQAVVQPAVQPAVQPVAQSIEVEDEDETYDEIDPSGGAVYDEVRGRPPSVTGVQYDQVRGTPEGGYGGDQPAADDIYEDVTTLPPQQAYQVRGRAPPRPPPWLGSPGAELGRKANRPAPSPAAGFMKHYTLLGNQNAFICHKVQDSRVSASWNRLQGGKPSEKCQS